MECECGQNSYLGYDITVYSVSAKFLSMLEDQYIVSTDHSAGVLYGHPETLYVGTFCGSYW